MEIYFSYFLIFSRVEKALFKPSPNPSPRKSFEEKTNHQDEEIEKTSAQTSPVAKIRQFVGLETNADPIETSKSSNEETNEDVISGIGSGKNL